jgi:hypothetical protein
MSQLRIERLRATLGEWERGNFAAGADILSPDVVLSSFIPDGMVVSHGWEEVGEQLREVFSQWASYRIEVERLIAMDDSNVLMEGRQYGVGKRSGIKISDALYVVFRFTGDRVTEMYWHPDRAEALKAAGLPE